MASLTLTLAAMAVFGGGSGSDLAKSLGEATKMPVLIECGSSQVFKGFEFDPADDNELARTVLRVAKLRRAPGVEHAYHWPGLPSWHFASDAVKQLAEDRIRAANVSEAYDESIRDGKVTLKTKPGRPLQITSIEAWPFSKKVTVDPFFGEVGLAAFVEGLPERDFLNLAAKTLGARIRVVKDTYLFEPNGVDVQRRALATLREITAHDGYAKRPEFQKAQVDLSRAALSSATPLQIEGLASGNENAVKLPMTPSLRQAAMRLLKALSELETQTEQTAQQQTFGPPEANRQVALTSNSAARFRNLDRRLLGYAELRKGFDVRLELATVDALGRPGDPIRVP